MVQGVAYEATGDQRRLVRGMAAVGVPQEDIATLLDIDAKTLRKHFRRELDCGSIEATTKVAQSLYQMATQGKNVAAAIFWMKARAGWREKHEVAVTANPLAHLSDRELDQHLAEELADFLPKLLARNAEAEE